MKLKIRGSTRVDTWYSKTGTYCSRKNITTNEDSSSYRKMDKFRWIRKKIENFWEHLICSAFTSHPIKDKCPFAGYGRLKHVKDGFKFWPKDKQSKATKHELNMTIGDLSFASQLLITNILFNAIPLYCSWVYNGCPVKNAELRPDIFLIVCSSLLVLIGYCVPFVHNNQATLSFAFNPFSNLEILGKLKPW